MTPNIMNEKGKNLILRLWHIWKLCRMFTPIFKEISLSDFIHIYIGFNRIIVAMFRHFLWKPHVNEQHIPLSLGKTLTYSNRTDDGLFTEKVLLILLL